MKLLKYPLALISPVLAYFAYTGSVGASNLLTGWTVFGLILAVIISGFIGLVLLFSHLIPKEEKFDEKLNEVKPEFERVQGFTFATCLDIGCIIFYIWCGWWGLATIEFIQVCILKFSVFCFLSAKFNKEAPM